MIKVDGSFEGKTGAHIECIISGDSELVAAEYAAITMALTGDKKGKIILNRALEIMEKEINDEEERSK